MGHGKSEAYAMTQAEADIPAPLEHRGPRQFAVDIIYDQQRRHFYLCDVLPLLGSIAGVWFLSIYGTSWIDWSLFIVGYVLYVIGIEVGYHRYFSHRAFKASPVVHAGLAILGSVCGQGPVLSWASNHRHHHKYSDHEGDTHSPHLAGEDLRGRLQGFAHAHLFWKYKYDFPNPVRYCQELIKDRAIGMISRHYYPWVLAGVLLPAAIEGLATWSWIGAARGLFLGGFLRLTVGQHMVWCINSLCHLVGTRPFKTSDKSTNVAILVIPTLGGSLHNNHHAFPSFATTSMAWWQPDPCGWVIQGMAAVGLVSAVRVPTREQILAKRMRGAESDPNESDLY
jgi:stearoyl-CoA desaturase (delta-9 desaturase)